MDKGEDRLVNELPKRYRRLLLVALVWPFAMGLLTGANRFYFLINLTLILASSFPFFRFVQLLRGMPLGRALLLLALGMLANWLSFSLGFVYGYGDGEGELVVAAVVAFIFCMSVGTFVLAMTPPLRTPADARAIVRECLSFRLRHLLVTVAVLSVLFAVARVNRGNVNSGWHVLQDTGGPVNFYETAGEAAQAWLIEQGYVETDRPAAAVLLPGKDIAEKWYAKQIEDCPPVNVGLFYGSKAIEICVRTEVPGTILPTATPQEDEADRLRKEMRQWWRVYSNRLPVP